MVTEGVDHASKQAERVRQGTGPRQTVSVLVVSLSLAAIAGLGVLVYWFVLS